MSSASSALTPEPAFRNDPYPSYEYVRRNGSFLRSYSNQGWLALGFDEVRELLRHPALSSDARRNRFFLRILDMATGDMPVPFLDNPPLLNQDPPNHTRLRKLVSEGFSNRFIQSLAPTIEVFVDELFDAIGNRERFDVVKSLAEPLPALVIAEMMGVPPADRGQFPKWSHDLTGATVIARPDMVARAAVAEQEMRRYLLGLIEDKRNDPADDFISRLVQAEVADDQLTRDEVVSSCILLLSAGHETTTRLIGNGLYTLLTNPDQLERLEADRSLLPNAIEEMLRYEPPVQMTLRFVAEDMAFRGRKLRKGQMVMINLAAANRDAGANAEPERFDITRPSINHVSFGYGIHLCLGLSLARLEARIAFAALLDRFPRLYLVDRTPAWQGNPFFRGMDSLNVSTTRRG